MPIPAILANAGGAFLNTVASGAAGGILGRLFGSDPGDENRAAIGRQNEFLRGTIGTRIATDKEYMDAIYPGTSPWERLGSSPAAPIQGQDAGVAAEAALMPLKIAQLNAASQQQVARQQTEAQVKVAEIGAETERYKSDQATNKGALGVSQTLLNDAQNFLATASATKAGAETEKIRTEEQVSKMAALLDAMPTETIDLGLLKYSHKPGWKQVLEVMGSTSQDRSDQTRVQKLSSIIESLPEDEFQGMKRDLIELAGGIVKLGGPLVKGVGSFLKKPPKVPKWLTPR